MQFSGLKALFCVEWFYQMCQFVGATFVAQGCLDQVAYLSGLAQTQLDAPVLARFPCTPELLRLDAFDLWKIRIKDKILGIKVVWP